MSVNRFNYQVSKQGEWFTSSDFHQVPMELTFPQEYTALASVASHIATLVNTYSMQGDGKLDSGAMSKLADLFEEASYLCSGDTARGLLVKSDVLRQGYSRQAIKELNELNESLSFVGGNISTWYGKVPGGLATCFATTANLQLNEYCETVCHYQDNVHEYICSLNKRLSINEVPKYVVSDLVFMSGEGDNHPKHIAYFLPEDEGFKHSPIKKTCYLSNVHQAKITEISDQLLAEFTTHSYRNLDIKKVGALGVLGHEFGHFVKLPETDFKIASNWNRWQSIMYQEIAADVFGFLILCEVWGPIYGFSTKEVCLYYFGELMRYINRGVNKFPDSDGMLFQLNYLVEFSAVELCENGTKLRIADPEILLAAMRSLGRCLCESLLKNDCELLADLEQRFGIRAIERNGLQQFFDNLSKKKNSSLFYQQSIQK